MNGQRSLVNKWDLQNSLIHTVNSYFYQVFDIVKPSIPSTFNADNSALGNCITDSFSIHTIGSTGTPQICGLNTGQHGKYLVKSDGYYQMEMIGYQLFTKTFNIYSIC